MRTINRLYIWCLISVFFASSLRLLLRLAVCILVNCFGRIFKFTYVFIYFVYLIIPLRVQYTIFPTFQVKRRYKHTQNRKKKVVPNILENVTACERFTSLSMLRTFQFLFCWTKFCGWIRHLQRRCAHALNWMFKMRGRSLWHSHHRHRRRLFGFYV